MSDELEIQSAAGDQNPEKGFKATPEASKQDGVIAGQSNQTVFEQAFATGHENDRNLSEPDMIALQDGETVEAYKLRVAEIQANRFGLFDSSVETTTAVVDEVIIESMPKQVTDHEFALGLTINAPTEAPSCSEKVSTFLQVAIEKANDPDGYSAYMKGELEKIFGIGAGLNDAKNQTKEAVHEGWNAIVDGRVATFLAKPNAINDPLFTALAGAINIIENDPSAVDHALEKIGKAVLNASDRYTKASSHDKGHSIGEAMFFMVNPEGSSEAAETVIQAAGTFSVQIDAAVAQGIQKSLRAIEDVRATSPELLAEAKQMLFDYTRSLNLTSKELDLAGIPKGYFDNPNYIASPHNNDSHFAMSKSDDAGALPSRGDLSMGAEVKPEKVLVSESYLSELVTAIETLSEEERSFLTLHKIEVRGVRRIQDVKPEMDFRIAGIYDPAEKAIYIPEQVWSSGGWCPNRDTAFGLRHEVGHAVNAKSHNFGEWISETADFRKAFKHDLTNISDEKINDLRLSYDKIALMRDEVFADMYAHTSGLESVNPRSKEMKELFPNCLNFVSKLRRER